MILDTKILKQITMVDWE